ncbi:MAG: hypothetical protein HY226_00630, partial [Candidatus Vogelbacteria bacterium]|nr:hypothetical protein [Candidatus Vogelbacteria bacterium]
AGAVKAANVGFMASSGEYVVKLDSDDVFASNLISEEIAILDAYAGVSFVYSDYVEELDGVEKIVSTKDNLYATVAIGTMFRRQLFVAEGFYDPSVFFAEYDLLLKTRGRWPGYHIDKPLFTYNRRRSSLTGDVTKLNKALLQLSERYKTRQDEVNKIRDYKMANL